MPYLTVADYITRFGNAETVRATDETKAGEVDEGKVEGAIEGATAEADSYLSARYALPIADPIPLILADIVADIARERLNRNRPTDIIATNAARARSQLRDLSAGRASIPASANAPAPTQNATGDAVSSHDGRARVFTDSALSEFVNLGYCGSSDRFNF